MWHLNPITYFDVLIAIFHIIRWFSTETWIFADKMMKNHINLFTPSLFTWSIYEIIYAALFKDYRFTLATTR